MSEAPKLRHPEKQKNPDNPVLRKPAWDPCESPNIQGL